LGPEFMDRTNLSFVVQELRRFPGKGWPLMAAALRSPVMGSRNMVLNTLEAWDGADWPPEAEPALKEAARAEPDKEIRDRMMALLRGGRGARTTEN
jgi:hypothetical protein